MEKNEILFNDIKSYEAPPVAFNINAFNLEKIKKYKIIKNKTLSILSKHNNLKNKNYELSKLKIDISKETLKSLEKNILLDIIIYIQNYCNISLISNIFIFNNSNLEINKSKNNLNEFLMTLKNKSNNIKIESEKKDDYYCINHNRYFKSNEALQNHYRASHKFKCEICGVYYSSKIKLEKHIINKNHQIHNNNNNNNILNKNNNSINIINYPNNNNIIIDENNESKNKEPKKVNKLVLLFEAMDKEKKSKNKKGKGKKIKKDLIQKENELKKQEELKRQEEELKRQEEERKRLEEERKRVEELKRQEEERKRLEELKRQEEERKRQEKLKRQEEERKKDEIKKIKQQNKTKSNKDYFYECYLDNKRFNSEKEYINHFSKYHNNDYPFYCDKCKKGFYSFQAIENHNYSKNH